MTQDDSRTARPQSVLFCCDHNAVRSPMAEGIMKKFYGTDIYVQSVGVKNSPASQRRALELTRFFHLDVEYWPILDPTGLGEGRDAKLVQFRAARDQISERLTDRFGPPVEKTA